MQEANRAVIAFLSVFLLIPIQANYNCYNEFNFTEVSSFLSTFIKPNFLVFDVGANIGKKTDVYLALGANVVCFESQPQCVQELKGKYSSNHGVSIEAIGLAGKPGMLEFFQSSRAPAISTFSKEYTQDSRFAEHSYVWDKKYIVPVSTLDSMISKYGMPEFCKIDVEGFEYEVLKGLSSPISCLSFECNIENIEVTKKCLNHLVALGYRSFNFAPGERGWFLYKTWLSAAEILKRLQKTNQDPGWKQIWGLWGDIYAKL